MFRSCPLTGDDRYGLDRVENDPQLLECMQGWHSGIEPDGINPDLTVRPGTRSCSLSIYTTGRVVFTMDADSLEIPAGKLELSRYINHVSQPVNTATISGLSYAYFKSGIVDVDGYSRRVDVEVVTDNYGLAYADASLMSEGGTYIRGLTTCVFR